MRISINLATHPFVELRPLFARLRLAMAALVLLSAGLGVGLHVMAKRARAAEVQMDALKAQTAAMQNERFANEGRMRQPQNRAVLDRSKFLNELFARKSFSWTAVMMDLENVLPAGVQVTSIEPVITPDGDVNIRLRVSGDREHAVEFVRNLERSQRFLSPRLANETAQTQEQGRLVQTAQPIVPGGVEFDILSGYNPLPKDIGKAAEKTVGPAKVKTSVNQTAGKPQGGGKMPKPAKTAKPGLVASGQAKKPVAAGATH